MSLLHRRAAQLLTRGDSEREDRLSLFNPFSGSCLLAKRGAPVAGWKISGNRRPLPVLSLSTPTPPWSSPAPSLPLSRQRTLRSQRATNQHWGAFYINDKVWARGGREGRRGRGPTKPPAGCSKSRARQGRADVSCRLAKAWQPKGVRRASERFSGVSPFRLDRQGSPVLPQGVLSSQESPASTLVTLGTSSACLPGCAGHHLHFVDSAVGNCAEISSLGVCGSSPLASCPS